MPRNWQLKPIANRFKSGNNPHTAPVELIPSFPTPEHEDPETPETHVASPTEAKSSLETKSSLQMSLRAGGGQWDAESPGSESKACKGQG